MSVLNPKLISPPLLCRSEHLTELRYQNNSMRRFALVSGSVSDNSRSEKRGISARVRHEGVYGFASSPDDSEVSVQRVLREAEENALLISRYKRAKTGPLQRPKPYVRRMREEWTDIEQKDYANYAHKIDKYILDHCPQVRERKITIYSDTVEKRLVVGDHCDAHFATPRTYLYFTLIVDDKTGGKVDLSGSVGGFGDLYRAMPPITEVYAEIDRHYQYVLDKAKAVAPKAGMKTCILSGKLAGMLAHEAVGHTVESDLVLAGSVALNFMNRQVAAKGVNLVDFAHTVQGKPAPLPVYVDDEGVPAEDVVIIEDGILRSYMHDRSSARHFGVKSQGNARAWAFYDEPLVRMRNTFILPGEDRLEDMIADTEEGYYLLATNNGQADNTGEFMFGICMGYEIKDGKLGRAIRDTTISGVAFDMLKTVDRIGDKLDFESNGFCGKKQRMAVGLGGPDLRCRLMMGGE